MNLLVRERVVRLILAAAVFACAWILLAIVGTAVLDTREILESLNRQEWLRFIKPNVKAALITRGWQPLTALFLAIFSYRFLKAPAEKLAQKRYKSQFGLTEDATQILNVLGWRKDFKRSLSGLIDETKLSRNQVEDALALLVSAGLVRERQATKGTGLRWTITQKGSDYLERVS